MNYPMGTPKNSKPLKIVLLSLIILFFTPQVSYTQAATLKLKWIQNSEGDLKGYKVYYRTPAGAYGEPKDAGNVTEYTIPNLTEGETYYVVITAYDRSENESKKSEEKSGVAQAAQLPPSTPTINFTKNPVEVNQEVTACINSTDPESDTISYYWGFKLDGEKITWWPGEQCTSFKPNKAGANAFYAKTEDEHGAQSGVGSNELIASAPTITTTIPSTTAPTTTPGPVTTSTPGPVTTSTPGPVTTSTPGPVTTSTPGPVTTSTPRPVTTTTIRDDTHLSSTVLINNGEKVTQAENVTLTLYATDKDGNELGKDTLMILKDDSLDWSDPEPYATTKNWVLSQEKGVKTISVRFGYTTDNWLSEAQGQIKLVGPQKQLNPVSIFSSSEFVPFWGKDNVSDGDPRTFWSSFLTFFWKNESITLDLGAVKLIDSVNMYATDFFNACYFPVNFQIELSKDKINWEELYTIRNYAPKPAKSDSWNFNSYEGRYIKVYITKAKIFFFFFYLTQIAEIEVYGYDLPEEQQSIKPDKTPLGTSGKPDKESKEAGTPGEEAGAVQGLPGIPGKPAITFNNQLYKESVEK